MEQAYTPGPWRTSAGCVDNPRLIVENDLELPVCAGGGGIDHGTRH